MKKIILVLLLLGNVFFLSFARGLFEEPETIIKKKILKCKDVVDVEVYKPMYNEFSRIYVKLTDDRYIEFAEVGSSLKNKDLAIMVINDMVPLDIYYRIKVQGRTDLPDYHMDNLSRYPMLLGDINYYFHEINSVQDIINNFDNIYEFICCLPMFPNNFKGKVYKLYDKNLDLSDWKSYKSDFQYFDGSRYNKFFNITMDKYNILLHFNEDGKEIETSLNFRRNYFNEKEKHLGLNTKHSKNNR